MRTQTDTNKQIIAMETGCNTFNIELQHYGIHVLRFTTSRRYMCRLGIIKYLGVRLKRRFHMHTSILILEG